MEAKKISIIMGIYNCEDTLENAIASITSQTYNNWELIMCDDGSTDNTYKVAKNLASRFPGRIVLLHDDKNHQLAHALNRCLKHVTGDYVARMDADDESFSERFEKQVAFLNGHPEYILCGTQILIESELSGRKYISKISEHPNKFTLHKHTPFNHATVMCRKEMFDILGGYSEAKTAERCEDQELWYRFFANGLTGANILEPLYRVVENKALIYRTTSKNRWNSFVTAVKGYKLLRYPWYWFAKPFIGLGKILVPKKLIVKYKRNRSDFVKKR